VPVPNDHPPNATATHESSDVTCLEGPVEKIDGKLILRIPLDAGGAQFVRCTRGISEIEGNSLKIVIQEWLAGMLRIEEGDSVSVDNADGKFNVRAVNPRSVH
jgi:hypothetical protein